MKNVLLAACMWLPSLALAQADDDDVAILQAVFGKTKRALVAEYVVVEEGHREAFWKLYDRYENDRREIVRERFALIRQYAQRYDSLDDKTATRLADGFLKNTAKTNTLNWRYHPKFEKLLGGLKAALFLQVETYLQTAMQAELQSQIPLIGELHRLNDHGVMR